jgi:hypothetical protein
MLLVAFLPLTAQETQAPLPKVVSASAPFYPRVAPSARIEGVVRLKVSTDGKHVVTFDTESGPPLLVQAAKENVKTWEFAQHKPASFEIRFDYKLSRPSSCYSVWSDDYQESVLLRLPSRVELSAAIPLLCDPAATIEGK